MESSSLIGHISIFVVVFFVMLGMANLIPGSGATTYRERYEISSRKTSREFNRFFINIKPVQLLILSSVLGAVLGYVSGSWILAGAIAAGGLVAPKFVLSIWKEMRSAQFEAQLMDALLLIGNSLKSGLDIVAGIERVASSMKPPISEEFTLVLNAYRLGTPLETALTELTERINSRTLETVVYAINIQRETGGNIIKIFDQLVTSIRDESKLQKKVRAMTSQSRSQIYFLAGFPWVLGVVFVLAAPELMAPAINNSVGQMVLLFLVIWEIIGIVVTKKIVTVQV